ncbi:50S rRNA methyltransferase [Francisella tularensis]|nr:50S rRNA methyltransferase [Francisella tularensis]AZP08709.1 50S rRNA methyltransferase [Francisella tularensis]
MMTFLLDIITFLQISFSTNIFRINYIITCIVNNHLNDFTWFI